MLRPKKGMFTEGDRMFAGGTPNFDERTGQSTGSTKGSPTKQAPTVADEPTPAPAPAPAPEPETEMTFTFVKGKERGDAAQTYLYGQTGEVQQVTVDELRDYFESDEVNRLPEVFGTFDNYLDYMTEREQMIQSGDYDTGNWSEYTGLSEEDELILDPDFDLSVPETDSGNYSAQLESKKLSSQQAAYNNWINSDANKALLEKYGVAPVVYSDSGDKFAWNGSAYVKTVDEKHARASDYFKAGIGLLIAVYGAPALANAIAPGAAAGSTSAVIANASAGAITSAANQLIMTGDVDLSDVLTAGAMAGAQEFIGSLFESSDLTPDEIRNQVQSEYITKADEARAAGNLADANFYEQVANQVGNVDISDITDPSWQNVIVNFAQQTAEASEVINQINENVDQARDTETPDVNSELVNQILDSVQPEPDTQIEETDLDFELPAPTQEEPEPDLPIDIPSPTLPPQEEPVEEDIFTDTTQEATGFEEGTITEDLLGEYLEPIRSEITASEERIVSQTQEFLASALANLPPNTSQEEIEAIVRNVVENAPQTETLSEEQVDGLVNSAVNAVRADLETGLETAEIERQEIIAGQEAGFIQAEQDRQRLMEAIVEARGQTTALSQEMRDLLAQSNQTMQEMFEGTGVDIDELRSGQLSQEEATNALREYTESVREELLSGQEAIRTELSGDIQNLEDRLNSLPPEIREIVAAQLEDLKVTENIDSVRQSITALEEVVSNIQPGTTPEQVAEQIEQADLVTSGQLQATAEGLFSALQAMAEGQTVELTTAQSEMLAEIAEGDAAVIERLSQYQGQLEDYLEERDITFDSVTGELSSDIERLEQQAEEFEQQTGERLDEATQQRLDLAQNLAAVDGRLEALSEADRQQYEELNLTVSSLEEEFGVDFDRIEEAQNILQTYAEEEFGAVREDIAGLEERMDANSIQQLAQLTGLRTEFLETLSVSEAAAIARNQGLSDQLTEQITGIRGETAAQIEGMSERLTERINEYEAQTGEQLEMAAEERAVLGGQLGTLTSDVARVAEDVIRANGRIEDMDAESRQRYDELGLSIEELSLRVGVNLEALQEGMLTQESAMRELIEETAQQTEQSLTDRLEEAEQGFATSLSDTEASLLSQITGVEAGVLQQLAEVEGGLQSQFGEQFGQVQQQVSGLGEQVAGLGEGLAGLGEGVAGLGAGLGLGLLGLGQQQQQIAAQLAKPEVIEFDPFLKGLSPFQPLTPIALTPQKQTDAMSELNKFIGRQTGMLV